MTVSSGTRLNSWNTGLIPMGAGAVRAQALERLALEQRNWPASQE